MTSSSFWADLFTILGLAKNRVGQGLHVITAAEARYRAAIIPPLRVFLVAAAMGTLALITAGLIGISLPWMYSLGTVAVGGLLTAGALLLLPYLLVIVQGERVPIVGPEIARALRWLGALVFASLCFGLVAQVLPLWQSPSSLVLIGTSTLALLVGGRLGLVRLPRPMVVRAFTAGLLLIPGVAVLGLAFPELKSSLRRLVASTRGFPAALAIRPEGEPPFVLPGTTRRVHWDQVWFARDRDGAFRLYDREGPDPRTGRNLTQLLGSPEYPAFLEWLATIEPAAADLAPGAGTGALEPPVAAPSDQSVQPVAAAVPPRDEALSRSGVRPAADAATVDAETSLSPIQAVLLLVDELPTREAALRPAWLEEVQGITVVVGFSSRQRRLAASVYNRLITAGIDVRLESLTERPTEGVPSIEYAQAEVAKAEAVRAILTDLVHTELNSARMPRPLTILLP